MSFPRCRAIFDGPQWEMKDDVGGLKACSAFLHALLRRLKGGWVETIHRICGGTFQSRCVVQSR
jgi:hypothetical protein